MPTKLPRLTQVTALPGLRLALVFADGWETTVDLDAFITSFPSLAPLADPARFATPAIEEWGSGVTWDDEGPLSLAATSLYRLASEQADKEAWEIVTFEDDARLPATLRGQLETQLAFA